MSDIPVNHPLDGRGLDHVAVALDTSDWQQFEEWCAVFGPRVGWLKVGLEAFVRWGPRAAEVALEAGGREQQGARVFLDLKLHDIPNTVAGAVGSVRSLGVHLVTVHAGGGPTMMQAAAEAAGAELGILAVTVLTSLDESELAALEMPGALEERVLNWGRLAVDAGCRGLVGSALEARTLRTVLPPDRLLVTPGIRFAGGDRGDQKRVATPDRAITDGADLLVVGRALTGASDPGPVLERLDREVLAGLATREDR